MRVYFDMCCLKRPFDDQSQPRIHMESEAMLALLAAPPEKLAFVRAPALDLENHQNPLPTRAARVRLWLEGVQQADLSEVTLAERTKELMACGFRNFDALHLASAELAGSGVFASCDDRLLATARRHASDLRVRVVDPVTLAQEVFS